MNRQQAGVALIEIILVIVVASGIVYFSIQQYLSFRRDADAAQVQSNVNAIFQAMTAYYRTNCYGQYDTSTSSVITGTLNPTNATPPAVSQPINITNDLITPKFLTTDIIQNPIVNAAGAGTDGYVAQFNRPATPADRMQCTSSGCATSVPIGKIYTWKIQVAVQLNDAATADQYLKILGGDCLSNFAGGIVTPCTVGSTGTFVVWERLPGYANIQAVSNYWVTLPTVSQFTQMYRTYPLDTLMDGSNTDNQYYLCGN